MKMGDMVLNFDLKHLEETFKNMSDVEMKRFKAQTLATTASIDLIMEIIESPSMLKIGFTPQEMAMFSLNVIATISAICVFRFAQRTNNPHAYCDNYKSMFQHIFDSATGVKQCQK